VCHGSLLYSDLMPAFLDAAKTVRLNGDDWPKVCSIAGDFNSNYDGHRREARATGDDYEADGTLDELRSRDIEMMVDILNRYVPDLCYFGVHEGDGSDFGVWPDSDVPMHGPATDEVGKGVLLPPAGSVVQFHWLLVNDHGNCTLYRKVPCGKGYKWLECWSMV
jgi:hypothetical protein